jgi:serine/threonine protein kinase
MLIIYYTRLVLFFFCYLTMYNTPSDNDIFCVFMFYVLLLFLICIVYIQHNSKTSFEKQQIEKTIKRIKRKNKRKWKIFKRRYTTIRFLGHGAYGSVYLVKDIFSHRHFAMKIILNSPDDNVQNEIDVMQLIHGSGIGPNIENYYVDHLKNSCMIVMHFFNMGTWDDNIHKVDDQTYKQLKIKISQKENRLKHEYGICHEDLHENNIALHRYNNGNIEPFLIDFGWVFLK